MLTSLLTVAAAACGADGENGNGNSDASVACVAESTQCDGSSFLVCRDNEWKVGDQCTAGVCNDLLGCIECTPGVNFCEGENVQACSDTGKVGGVVETCTGNAHCESGSCRDLCAEAETARSYLGCEYWAVDLDNAREVVGEPSILGCILFDLTQPGVVLVDDVRVCSDGNTVSGECDSDGGCPATFNCVTQDMCMLDAAGSPFAVVVSNPNAFEVTVNVANGSGTSVDSVLAGGEVKSIYPSDIGFADQSIDGSAVAAAAYRVQSTAPIVAYQFNPLDNENVFSNDGSLLIPRQTFDTDYYAMTQGGLERRPVNKDFNGYVAVVAWKDGTEVTVTPTGDVRAGQSQPAIASGVATVFTLNAFDVLSLESTGTSDLTGTQVQVTGGDMATVGVFAGHEAVSLAGATPACCADHIEEMMFPTSTWGKEFAIARSQQRVTETDLLRIMAQVPNTTVTISSSATCPVLAAGEFCEVDIDEDVEITSTEPILIGHYLRSVLAEGVDPAGSGDPSLAIAVPVEQFRSSYSFLVPMEYQEQYISIVAIMGNAVTLDGTDISAQLTAMGSNGRGAARIMVNPGQHSVECAGGCGVEVYGYSDAVSYFFAAGLDLEQIVID